MGRTAKWLRGLLGGKKNSGSVPEKSEKGKKRWGFVKSFRDKEKLDGVGLDGRRSYREGGSKQFVDDAEQSRHAIAVAAATAAVAEAAVAAAQAAAAVARLTSSGRGGPPASYVRAVDFRRQETAAIRIQSVFRGYLARRALKALKALVKLQALVRGYLTRKHSEENLRYLEAVVRVQTRARANLCKVKDGCHYEQKYLHHNPAPATPEKPESAARAGSTKYERLSTPQGGNMTVERNGSHTKQNLLDSWMDEQEWDKRVRKPAGTDDERSAKILEVDTGNPYRIRNNNLPWSSHSAILTSQGYPDLLDSPSKDSTTAQLSVPSPSSEEQSFSPLRFGREDPAFWTAENSPHFYSASSRPGSSRSRRGPFTPAKSDCSRNLFCGYPNYMANTESSRAKVRSQSAPKQRPELDKTGSAKRFSIHGFADGGWGSGTGVSYQRTSSRSGLKAYPGSGRLDRLGMPVGSYGGFIRG